jgi:hypothetical protein
MARMQCDLCGAEPADKEATICGACYDSLHRPVETTGVDWSDAVAVATRVQRSQRKGEMVCSFCARPRAEVAKLLAGNDGAFICDGCVELCRRIIDSEK